MDPEGVPCAELPCGYLAFAEDGAILEVNGDLERMVGEPRAALLGRHVEEIFTRASAMYLHIQVVPSLAREGRVEQIEVTLRTRAGGEVPVLFNALRRARGAAVIHEAVVVRIGERKGLEDELLRVRKAAEMLPGAICQILVRPDGSLSLPYASQGLRAIFGLLPGQVRGDAAELLAVIDPEDRARLTAALRVAPGAPGMVTDIVRVRGQGGERAVELHATAEILPAGGVLWHGYLLDVTARRSVEAALRDKLAAEEASRAKSAFLAGMSHELRTPLNGILGIAELLLEGVHGPLSAPQRASLERLSRSGEHLLSLINDLLDVARVESGRLVLELAAVDPAALCRESLALVEEPARRKQVSLAYAVGAEVPPFRGDPRRLKQVLVNLLANAVKFTHEGGHVRLDVALGAAPATLELAVTDDGVGIAPADHRRIFRPFEQVSGGFAHLGSGLGLSLVEKLSTLHGGAVRVESELGAGARFVVTVPLTPAATPAPGPRSSAACGPGGGRVLVVDDDENSAVAAADYLRARGFEVAVARDGAAAIEAARAFLPDVILMDERLPLLDGPAATRALRADPSPALRAAIIFALTAQAMPADRDRFLEAGADEHIAKPANLKALAARIEERLRAARAR